MLTLNLALKKICAAKITERNSDSYGQYFWISQITDDTTFIKKLYCGILYEIINVQ